MIAIAILQAILFIASCLLACNSLGGEADNYNVRPLNCLIRRTRLIELYCHDIMHYVFILTEANFGSFQILHLYANSIEMYVSIFEIVLLFLQANKAWVI